MSAGNITTGAYDGRINPDATGTPEDVRESVIVYGKDGRRIVGARSDERPAGKLGIFYIDYDGTPVKTFWVDPGSDFTGTPPEVPDHTAEGLEFVEWNWLPAELINIQQDTYVGACYGPVDHKSHIWIDLNDNLSKTIRLFLEKGNNDVLVDWGDGTISRNITVGNTYLDHTYPSNGKYEITAWVENGNDDTLTLGYGSNKIVNTDGAYKVHAYHKISGNTLGVGGASMPLLQEITFSPHQTGRVVINTSQISILIVPKNADGYSCQDCRKLHHISARPFKTNIAAYTLQNCGALPIIPLLQGNITTIPNSALRYIYSAKSVTIPESVTAIETNAFNSCLLKEILMLPVTPPTLTANAITVQALTRIYVPDASVDAYKTATNWAAYANYIYPISERI